MQKEFYQIASKTDSRKIAEFLSKDDQLRLSTANRTTTNTCLSS